MPDPAPVRGRWTVRTCPTCGAASVDPEDYVCTCTCALESVEVVPVPDEAAIERAAEAARKVPSGARDRWQRVAEAVLRAALEPPSDPGRTMDRS